MRRVTQKLVIAALIWSVTLPAWAEFETLDLERRCGQCHDVAHPPTLTDSDWLNRMRNMGPLEGLNAEQRREVVGFLRYHGWEVNQIVGMATERHLFEEKCGLCHAVERIFVRELNQDQLRATVQRMRDRAPQWISENDAERIVSFLESGARGVARPEHRTVDGTPADVFLGRCAACHPLERAYLYLETQLDPHWPLLVKRMQAKAPDWISNEEADQITTYLSSLKPLLRQSVSQAPQKPGP